MARQQLIFHNDEYARIGGSILKAIAHEPKGDDATAEGFFNWLAGPVKDVVQGVMWRKDLESLITLDLSGCAFGIAHWKKLTRNMTHLRIPFPPQHVPSHRATLHRLFLLTAPFSTDFDEDTKAKSKEMLEYNVRLIQDIPELIIVDVVQALQWLKGEFGARVAALRIVARAGKIEGRDEGIEQVIQRQFREVLDRQANSGQQERPDDLIRLAVAVTNFSVARVTLLRAIGDNQLTSYRAAEAPENSPHLVSEREVAKCYPPRRRK